MPCFLVILGMFMPRLVLFFGWLFGVTNKGFEGWLWPLLGFIFMPFTTLVWGLAHAYGESTRGIWLVLFIFAVLLDLGSWGSTTVKKEGS